MSALDLNASQSMLPVGGGMIRAMSGGFTSSPYTGSDSYDTSLLRALPPSAAPIAEYKGGGGYNNNNGSGPEGDGIDQNSGSNAASSAASSIPVAISAANAASSAAPASMSNAASSAAVAISAANAVSAPAPAPLANPVPSENNAASVAVAIGAIPSDLIDSNGIPSAENDVDDAADAARVAVAISAMPSSSSSSSSSTIVNESDPFTTAAIAVAASSDANGTVPKSDKKMKTITVHGINYDVTDPAAEDNEGWKKLLAKLRLDRLKDPRKEKIKQMIYDEPTCLEKDFPVSSLMTCAPIRFIIENILIELLHSGRMDDSKSELKMVFNPQKDVEALSKHAVERASERPSEAAKAAGGTRKARQRRIIRKHT